MVSENWFCIYVYIGFLFYMFTRTNLGDEMLCSFELLLMCVPLYLMKISAKLLNMGMGSLSFFLVKKVF